MKKSSNPIDYFRIDDKINDKKINNHIGHDSLYKKSGCVDDCGRHN